MTIPESVAKKLTELQIERICAHNPFSTEYVSAMEAFLTAPLPKDYASVADRIAGCIAFGVFSFADPKGAFGGETEWNIEQFLACSDEPVHDIVSRAEMLRGAAPPGLLPVADGSGRNVIVLSAADCRAPGVYLWKGDEDETEAPTEDSLFYVAPTFTEFVLGMKPDVHYAA